MTTGTLPPTSGVGSIPSFFQPFASLRSTALIDKITWVFGLQLAAIIGGASRFLYRFYKPEFSNDRQLGDPLKIAQCKELLSEIREKQGRSEDVNLQLQRCEALLGAVDGTRVRRHDRLWAELAKYYAIDDPDRAYQIAEQLSEVFDVCEIARLIREKHPGFNAEDLDHLVFRAFQAHTRTVENNQHKYFLHAVKTSLECVKTLISPKRILVTEALSHAENMARTAEISLGQLEAYCLIAQTVQKTGIANAPYYLTFAQDIKAKLSGVDLILGHLVLADTWLLLKDIGKMTEELGPALELLQRTDLPATLRCLEPFAELKQKILESDFAAIVQSCPVTPLIEKALSEIPSAEHPVPAYLTIARICQEHLNNPTLVQRAIAPVFDIIQLWPETRFEETEWKILLLSSFVPFYKTEPEKALPIMQLLEKMSERLPNLPPDDRRKAGCLGDRFFERSLIHGLYNELGLTEQSNAFVEKLLSHIKNQKTEHPRAQISSLVAIAKHHSVLPEQKTKILQAAEALESQLPSQHDVWELTVISIATGYLHVDKQKAFQLLKECEDAHARRQVRAIVVSAVAIVALIALEAYLHPHITSFFVASCVTGLGVASLYI